MSFVQVMSKRSYSKVNKVSDFFKKDKITKITERAVIQYLHTIGLTPSTLPGTDARSDATVKMWGGGILKVEGRRL